MSSQAPHNQPIPKPTVAKNGQHVMPAPNIKAPPPVLANEESRKYLLEAGWTEQSRNDRGESFWLDPAGQGPRRGKLTPTRKLPGKDGTDDVVVQQVVCPPTPWAHPTTDALTIQRQRDEARSATTAAPV